ncbi:MAG: hypothetical protein ACR2PX_15890 [Endozoicomonas sp.]|uniref:hypothetical protein n=1 Tax=Endozoicomonas sp. TaxID=1892382 RepID=UPI003D9B79E3
MIKRSLFLAGTSLLMVACSPTQQPEALKTAELTAPAFIGSPATPKPFEGKPADNLFMAPHSKSTMHSDGYNSDVHSAMGPLGINPQMTTRSGSKLPGGMCATVTFDQQGQLVALCASLVGFELQLLAPRSLELLARYELPSRPSSFQALVKRDRDIIMSDTSGGAYYYLDDKDRVVLADSTQTIIRVGHTQDEQGNWSFNLENSWDLSKDVPNDCMDWGNWFPSDECDPITAVMPDSNGLIWWVTRYGRIGTLNPENGSIKGIRLDNEEIQNGFSVDQNAVYIVSDHATYSMKAGADDSPQTLWKETYDRGSARKVGSINQGSGTTPTLIGDQYITVTDNADEKINLLVYRREANFEGDRLICSVPLFSAGQSSTDNSMIGYGRSIIIENNFGYTNAMEHKDWKAVKGGISRIDIREDESGCDTTWTSSEKAPSVVPKLSSANGLAYFYTFEPQEGAEDVAWYLMALDAETGKTTFKIRTGAGQQFDNNWAPISIGPDGTAYIGTLNGILAIWDDNRHSPER